MCVQRTTDKSKHTDWQKRNKVEVTMKYKSSRWMWPKQVLTSSNVTNTKFTFTLPLVLYYLENLSWSHIAKSRLYKFGYPGSPKIKTQQKLLDIKKSLRPFWPSQVCFTCDDSTWQTCSAFSVHSIPVTSLTRPKQVPGVYSNHHTTMKITHLTEGLYWKMCDTPVSSLHMQTTGPADISGTVRETTYIPLQK